MNRASRPNTSRTRLGYTLLEVLLALGLSGLLMMLVYGAMQSFWRLSTTAQIDAERCQLARQLIRQMELDIRSVAYKSSQQQPSGGSGGQAADEGFGSAAEETGTESGIEPAVEMLTDDTALLADVHLYGDSQSLEMIVLRPTRNRSGSQEEAMLLANESDRRRVGYALTDLSGQPGLYYRNTDQQIEQIMERQGNAVDPATQYVLLAPEVADLRFQYLDGATSTWVDQWHSRDMGGLPRAIKISLQFHPPAAANSNQLQMPRASASTEMFQAVVHLPLSNVPLEL